MVLTLYIFANSEVLNQGCDKASAAVILSDGLYCNNFTIKSLALLDKLVKEGDYFIYNLFCI